MFKNALVSVSDKSGLVEFLKPYLAQGLRIVSTGGTHRHLQENGISAVEVSDQTGFPEVMDGRVKTLHPKIHMALLARSQHAGDMKVLKEAGLLPFDLVIVNLYPFALAREQKKSADELIEYVDIGGVSLLRAAAKNHAAITVVSEPSDYGWIASKQDLTLRDRRRLAARAFQHTSRYDDLIAKSWMSDQIYEGGDDQVSGFEWPNSLVGDQVAELRYGENPHQQGWWYRRHEARSGLHQAKVLHGKALSYNNLLDLDSAWSFVKQPTDIPLAVAVKHCNPCGVASDTSLSVTIERAIQSDPVSVFGGVMAVNREIDSDSADAMAKIFLECIIAPGFTEGALEKLRRKKDLRLLAMPIDRNLCDAGGRREYRSILGGYLVQTVDSHEFLSTSIWSFLGEKPSELIMNDLKLAWIVSGWLRSNAIAIVSNKRTVGLGMGQVNRVDAVEQAIGRMRRHHDGVASPVMASDAFFPFPDSVELAAAAGIKWVIQPGGSIRDEEVFARAKELGVNLVLTGSRHFRH